MAAGECALDIDDGLLKRHALTLVDRERPGEPEWNLHASDSGVFIPFFDFYRRDDDDLAALELYTRTRVGRPRHAFFEQCLALDGVLNERIVRVNVAARAIDEAFLIPIAREDYLRILGVDGVTTRVLTARFPGRCRAGSTCALGFKCRSLGIIARLDCLQQPNDLLIGIGTCHGVGTHHNVVTVPGSLDRNLAFSASTSTFLQYKCTGG